MQENQRDSGPHTKIYENLNTASPAYPARIPEHGLKDLSVSFALVLHGGDRGNRAGGPIRPEAYPPIRPFPRLRLLTVPHSLDNQHSNLYDQWGNYRDKISKLLLVHAPPTCSW